MTSEVSTTPPIGGQKRGRTRTRSRREIAAAAIAVADNDGLSAVTMRAVARNLSTGPASLYRYVKTRQDLIAIMVDEVNAEFDFTNRGQHQQPWLDQVVDLAHQARKIYRQHPWMLDALDTTPTLGPNGLAYLEHALAILSSTNADASTKLETIGVFGGLVRLLCKHEQIQQDSQTAPPNQPSLQVAATEPVQNYPHLSAALAEAGPVDNNQFDRVIRRVVLGMLAADSLDAPSDSSN